MSKAVFQAWGHTKREGGRQHHLPSSKKGRTTPIWRSKLVSSMNPQPAPCSCSSSSTCSPPALRVSSSLLPVTVVTWVHCLLRRVREKLWISWDSECITQLASDHNLREKRVERFHYWQLFCDYSECKSLDHIIWFLLFYTHPDQRWPWREGVLKMQLEWWHRLGQRLHAPQKEAFLVFDVDSGGGSCESVRRSSTPGKMETVLIFFVVIMNFMAVGKQQNGASPPPPGLECGPRELQSSMSLLQIRPMSLTKPDNIFFQSCT